MMGASRKGQQNKGKRSYGNLGSAAKFIGDEETKLEAPEKLQFVKRAEKNKNLKERAKIKYNFKDFLAHYQNLSEQCIFLVQSLAEGTQECIICQNPIYQRSAIWNCKQCCQPFHLGCIKRWISKLNKSLEQSIADNQEEERKENQRVNREAPDSSEDEQDSVNEDELTDA